MISGRGCVTLLRTCVAVSLVLWTEPLVVADASENEVVPRTSTQALDWLDAHPLEAERLTSELPALGDIERVNVEPRAFRSWSAAILLYAATLNDNIPPDWDRDAQFRALEDAKRLVDDAVALGPQFAAAWYLRALITAAYRDARFPEVRSEQTLDQRQSVVRTRLSEEVRDSLDKAHRYYPAHAEFWWSAIQEGIVDDVIEFAAANPKHFEGRIAAGRKLCALGEADEARPHFAAAYGRAEAANDVNEMMEATIAFARCLKKAGEIEDARTVLERMRGKGQPVPSVEELSAE